MLEWENKIHYINFNISNCLFTSLPIDIAACLLDSNFIQLHQMNYGYRGEDKVCPLELYAEK